MPDFELEENENDEEVEFPPAERKIVTQPYDLSIRDLVDQWSENTLVLPEIQREYVWDNARASRLVESLLLNIPIPILYFAETEDARWEIIDGHQRINSLARFVTNEFSLSSLAVLQEFNRLRFHQLPDREQRYLERRAIRAIVISNESHPNMKFEIFERLNTGAVVLNAQEIRNSLYRGRFNALLRDLAKDASLRACIGSKLPRKRMVDEELVLRFFALRMGVDRYRPPLKRFLNEFMGSVRNAEPETIEDFRGVFETTAKRAVTVLGRSAFRPIDASGRPLEVAVNRALFEAQMLGFSWVPGGARIEDRVAEIRREFAGMFDEPPFMDAISRATGDRSRTYLRLRRVVMALEAAGVPVHTPDLPDR